MWNVNMAKCPKFKKIIITGLIFYGFYYIIYNHGHNRRAGQQKMG